MKKTTKEIKETKKKEVKIVFIDQIFPFDYTYSAQSITPPNPDIYYEKLDNFFTELEKEHKTKVVIAEHPQSDYDMRPDYFRGRKRIKGKTEELIEEADIVLGHLSSELNLAKGKKIILLTYAGLDGQLQDRMKLKSFELDCELKDIGG